MEAGRVSDREKAPGEAQRAVTILVFGDLEMDQEYRRNDKRK